MQQQNIRRAKAIVLKAAQRRAPINVPAAQRLLKIKRHHAQKTHPFGDGKIAVAMLAYCPRVHVCAAEFPLRQVLPCQTSSESAAEPWAVLDHRQGLVPWPLTRSHQSLLRLSLVEEHVSNGLRAIPLRGLLRRRHKHYRCNRQDQCSRKSFNYQPILT